MKKSLLRQRAKSFRQSVDLAVDSRKISTGILEQIFFKNAKNILLYFPMKHEIDLKYLLNNQSKNYFLPRVSENNLDMTIHKYISSNKLVKNSYGVYEPCVNSEKFSPEILDLVIVPALMADLKGFRLGYGAGFYDRFLKLLKKDCIKVVPVLNELLIDSLPIDEWDEPVDYIVTQAQVLKINKM